MSARLTDPATSHLAAQDTGGRTAIKYQLLAIYAHALLHENRGLTDEEAMELCNFDMADDGHRRRCSDLRAEGLIAQVVIDGAPQTRVSARTGKARMVCTITMTGIELLGF